MLDNVNDKCKDKPQAITMYTRCIVVRHNGLHPLSKLTIELCNFIKIENITIKAKINKKPNLLVKQATPGVSGGCGLWSTLPVSSTEEIMGHTTSCLRR